MVIEPFTKFRKKESTLSALVRLIVKQFRFLQILGTFGYLKWLLANTNSVFSVRINSQEVFVRKGTPDLSVAISCLHGEFDILRHAFPRDYQGVIVDAGGYIGTAAIAFSLMYPNSRIFSIEPSDANFLLLKKNIDAFTNIQPIHAALVADVREKVFLKNRGTGHWGYSTVDQPKDCPEAEVVNPVQSITLSNLDCSLSEIGILKLDIEGGEYKLLKDDADSMKKLPVIIAELHDRIVDNCTEMFFEFSRNRLILKDRGEKYLSISKL